MRAMNRVAQLVDTFGGKNIQYSLYIIGLWTRNLMRLTNSGHPDVYWAVAFAERSEYNVTSTFASQPIDERHEASLYAAAMYP